MKNTFKVQYDSGVSRWSDNGIDYMKVNGEINGEEFELYAEAEPIGHYKEDGEWVCDDEYGTCDELFAEIVKQAEALGITADMLEL